MTTAFRFTQPPPPSAATGVNAEVFAQLAFDFGVGNAPTFVVLSDSPPLLTGTWALLRESLLAGRVSRTDKEVVAAGVSLANRCPFCVDAHTVLLHATGNHTLAETIARGGQPAEPEHRRLLAWGKDIRSPRPFPAEQTPEHVGTALAFHFINRLVSALLNEDMLPGGAQKYRFVRSAAGRSLTRTVRRELPPGESLKLLQTSGAEPAWAAGAPVGTAYGALREAALMGAALLSDDDRALVRTTVAAHDGVDHPALSADWLPAREDRPGARLALLAALAPYRITNEDVTAWRTPRHSDLPLPSAGGGAPSLVHLVAYGAITAVERIEEQL